MAFFLLSYIFCPLEGHQNGGSGEMRVGIVILLTALISALPVAGAQTDIQAAVLSQLRSLDEFEMAMGKLASQNADSDEVRRLGDRLYRDHRDLLQRLIKVTEREGIKLTKPILTPNQQSAVNRLAKMNGAAFDEALLDLLQSDYGRAIVQLRGEAADIGNRPARIFLERVLPILDEHRQLGSKIDQRLAQGR